MREVARRFATKTVFLQSLVCFVEDKEPAQKQPNKNTSRCASFIVSVDKKVVFPYVSKGNIFAQPRSNNLFIFLLKRKRIK